LINLKKELKNLEKHLRTRPDNSIIEGYRKAKKEYEEIGDIQLKYAMDMIKRELDRRELDIN